MAKALSVLTKDLRSEFRTRYAFNSLVMFALTTLVVVSFSLGGLSLSSKMTASLFWIVLLFSAMSGLAWVFIKEEQAKTANTLKLVSSPSIIFLGKFFFNLILLALLELILVPLFLILMNLRIESVSLFFAILILGSLGLVCATTIIAAIIAQATVKGALFAALSFPILLPLLITVINGTRLSLEGASFSQAADEIKILISYSGVMLGASFLLFDFVWSD